MHPHEYELIQAASQPQGLDLLTKLETAKALRISTRHLERLEELGEGPPRVRLGERRIAYPRAGLLAWVQQRTTAPKAA